MKFKQLALAVMIGAVSLTGCQSTSQNLDPQSMTMNKKLKSMERAVVLMSEGVKVKPSELNQGTKVGAALIAAGAGTAAVGGYNSSRNTAVAGGAVALAGLATMLIANANDNPIPAMRYTIQVMKTNEMSEVIQTVPQDQMPFGQNQPVLMKSYSDGTRYLFADTTQGVSFNKAQDTVFTEDVEAKKKAEVKAKEDALAKAIEDEKRIKRQTEANRIAANKAAAIEAERREERKNREVAQQAKQQKLEAERVAAKQKQEEKEAFLWDLEKQRLSAQTNKVVAENQAVANKLNRDDEVQEQLKTTVVEGAKRAIEAEVVTKEARANKTGDVIDAQIRAIDNISEGIRNKDSSVFQ